VPRAAFTTLGCKVNQYETQKILESFEEAGFSVVPFESPADVYVINSCSVTSDAERKSRYTIRRATRHNPDAKVVVTGCASQMAINKREEMEGADVIVPNPEKLDTLSHVFRELPILEKWVKDEPAILDQKPIGRTRATLKVQDGCSVMCSYCSIPYTRPGMVSRPFETVMAEARKMAEMGYLEVVLTGVLIGAYGKESGSGGPDFEEMLEALARESGVPRVRISSIEMRQVTPRLVDLIKNGLVVPHLHIPLQCGNTEVLRDMNRPYTMDDYLGLCRDLYQELPDLSLTADIMVGFPTETAERFESSVHVCEEAKYLKVHAFTFSPRFGTPADAWGDPVTPPEKASRRMKLMEVSTRTGREHARKFVGRTLRVLVEGKETKDGLLEGLSDNYLTVRFAGAKSLQRTLQWVTLTEEKDGVVYGDLAAGPVSSGLRIV
jgi:threonylcarbamoyladenosine tRNA methylthiotransferase MtaB